MIEYFDIGNHLELAARILARPQYDPRARQPRLQCRNQQGDLPRRQRRCAEEDPRLDRSGRQIRRGSRPLALRLLARGVDPASTRAGSGRSTAAGARFYHGPMIISEVRAERANRRRGKMRNGFRVVRFRHPCQPGRRGAGALCRSRLSRAPARTGALPLAGRPGGRRREPNCTTTASGPNTTAGFLGEKAPAETFTGRDTQWMGTKMPRPGIQDDQAGQPRRRHGR